MLPLSQWKVRGRERKLLFNNEDKDMKAEVWTKVEDGLPDNLQLCLIAIRQCDWFLYTVAFRGDGKWNKSIYHPHFVIDEKQVYAWMPIVTPEYNAF